MLRIQDFCDMVKFEAIMDNWAKSTGLARVAVGAEGEYISECYNFTEICIDLTRGSAEGKRRCEKCDKEGKGVYECHAGLVDFAIPITLNDGTVLGSVIGGQVLPENPSVEAFRRTARELGIIEDVYIDALHKVSVKTREEIEASASLLGDVINMFVRSSYAEKENASIMNRLLDGIKRMKKEFIDNDQEAWTNFSMIFDNLNGFNNDFANLFQGNEESLLDGPLYNGASFTQLRESSYIAIETMLEDYRERLKNS